MQMFGLVGAALMALSLAGCDDAVVVRVGPAEKIRTLVAARDEVRSIKARRAAQGGSALKIEVVLADGIYRLDAPLELSAKDSGTTESPIVWRAEHRGKAVVSGGLPLTWRRPSDPKVASRLPACAQDKVVEATVPGAGPLPSFLNGNQFSTPSNDVPVCLFAGLERLPCARWPNDAEAMIVSVVRPGLFETDATNVAAWAREKEPWVYGRWPHAWVEVITTVRPVDVSRRRLSVPEEHLCKFGFGMSPATDYHVFNCLCELDRPGEWVVDRSRRAIWLWPKGTQAVEVTLADGLVRGKGVSDVVFDGLVFEKCRKDALVFEKSERVKVVASSVRATGGWGVRVLDGHDCRVEGCDLFDLGEGGIYLSGGELRALTPANHVAVNNHLSYLGKILANYRPAVALWGVGCRAEHNLIHHLRHAAIEFRGNEHYIGWNVIHDVCMDNYDSGAIYSWQNSWLKRGGTIEHNLVRRVGRLPHPTVTHAIYLDDHTSDVTVRHNIVDYSSHGLHNGGGQVNRWYGNVVLNSANSWTVSPRGRYVQLLAEVTNVSYCSSVAWKSHYPDLFRYLRPPGRFGAEAAVRGMGLVVTNNVFAGCGPENWLDTDWDRSIVTNWQIVADNAVVSGDPGFRDYRAFDWRAASDSPNRDVIDACAFEKMGLFPSPLRFSPAVRFGEEMTPAFDFGSTREGAAIKIEGRGVKARDHRQCARVSWNPRNFVVRQALDVTPGAPWRRYEFAFVPEETGVATLKLGGHIGVRTLYRNFTFTGARFETTVAADKVLSGRKNEESEIRVAFEKDVPAVIRFEAKAEE